jgi:serine/threonine protein phosphatase PrpC
MHSKGNPVLNRFDNLSNFGVKNCNMFAVYDGHGGADCCNFLKENLHSYVLNSYSDKDLDTRIKASFNRLDSDFFIKARNQHFTDTSGSCALALLVVGNHPLIRYKPVASQCWRLQSNYVKKPRKRAGKLYVRP